MLEAFLHASPDALVVVDGEGVIRASSKAVTELFGYTPEELLGQPVECLVPEGSRRRHGAYRTSYSARAEVRPMGVGLRLMGSRKDGTEFPVDVSLVPSGSGPDLRIGAFIREATDRRRNEDLLRSVNEISHEALAGASNDEILALVARRARVLVGATSSWVAIPTRGDRILVAAADGHHAHLLLDMTLPMAESLAGQVMSGSGTLQVEDLSTHPAALSAAREADLGPGLYLPMLTDQGPVGVLIVARLQGDALYSTAEVGIAEIFASAVAVVLALGSARQALEDARVTAEHERIARDLHDTVIQRLFAMGMRLQATERLADPPVAERISDTVENIDEVIREIRETIFDLNHPNRDEFNVRYGVRAITGEAAGYLGFSPRVNFRGPVETAVTGALRDQLIPVVREALANVGRHARASSADVLVSVSDGWLMLSVADDGIGISDQPTAGQGTSNMRERAERLGGRLAITRRKPSGTLLQWKVPISG